MNQYLNQGVFQKPLLMGIVNLTADSFYSGGRSLKTEQALEHAETLIKAGADIIDIGGESTRPGAQAVSVDEELMRILPVISELRHRSDIPISIDTYKPAVMSAAVANGASIINDIKALREPNALTVAASLKVPICLMHMQGEPQTMQINPYYESDVLDDINTFFTGRIEACLQAGIARDLLILDPGFGYGKTIQHNLRIVKQLSVFKQHNLPLLLGFSRKSTIGAILKCNVENRLMGGLALSVFTALQGVSILRTHDVAETKAALDMLAAIMEENDQQGVVYEPT